MSCPTYSNVSDQQILGWIQDALLEPNNGGASLATSQFDLNQLINSLQQSSLDFQRDSGVVACHIGFQGDADDGTKVSSGQEQVQLPQDFMDARRRAWIQYDTSNPPVVLSVTELPVQDSMALDSNTPQWEATLGQPFTSDESLPPIPAINLSTQPIDDGALDLIYTPVPNTLSNTGQPLSFPPDFAIPVFYRAMQILYMLQGEGADDQRARYAGERYNLLVALTKGILFYPNLVTVQGGG